MEKGIHEVGFGLAGAAICGLGMLLLGILGTLGFYTEAVAYMEQWHYFFNLTPVGILLGIIEAAVVGFIFTFIFAWVYNHVPRHT